MAFYDPMAILRDPLAALRAGVPPGGQPGGYDYMTGAQPSTDAPPPPPPPPPPQNQETDPRILSGDLPRSSTGGALAPTPGSRFGGWLSNQLSSGPRYGSPMASEVAADTAPRPGDPALNQAMPPPGQPPALPDQTAAPPQQTPDAILQALREKQQPAPAAAAPQTSAAPTGFPDANGMTSQKPMPADYYSSASPPPAQFAPIVAEAAAKHGVPEQVLTWVGSHEAGWNPNIGTNKYGATGMYQFKDGTAKEMGIDPNDPAQSIDGAARYLKKLYDANGQDWTKAVEKYGTFSTGLGAQRDQLARDGFTKFMGGVASEPAPATGTPAQAPQGAPQPSPGYGQPVMSASGQDTASLLASLRSSPSQQMGALAAGLLSGPTFGRGLGAGLTNLNELTQKDKGLAVQMAQARALADYRVGQLGLGAGRLANSVNKTDLTGQTVAFNTTGQGAAIRQQNADAATKSADAKSTLADAQIDGNLTPEAKAMAKANVTDVQVAAKQEDSARESLRTASDVLAVLDKEGPAGLTGPDVASKVKRYFVNNFGVEIGGVTPTGIQMTEKSLAALRNGELLANTKGSVPRSNAELQALQSGMASMDRNPDALRAILQQSIAHNQRVIRAGEAWRGMSDTDRRAALASSGGLYASWRSKFGAEDPAEAPVSGTPGQLPAPRVQQGNGTWNSTSNGVKWSVQ